MTSRAVVWRPLDYTIDEVSFLFVYGRLLEERVKQACAKYH